MVYYLSNLPDGLIYGLLAMGIYVSLRILDIPDLTTEGSFGFGAVISVLISLQGHPLLGLLAGLAAGILAGAVLVLPDGLFIPPPYIILRCLKAFTISSRFSSGQFGTL